MTLRLPAPCIALFGALVALLVATRPDQSPKPSVPIAKPASRPTILAAPEVRIPDSLERITFGGELSPLDYAEIRRIVNTHCHVSTNITIVEILAPGVVEVRTGPANSKELSGGGEILKLERRENGWRLAERTTWIG